ncbi:hypothetical protein GCM10023321_27670 [Pseudonocardia eucalypti]|uniref:SnoaL-like domain-containing protein n=1 Tax=Pseudonocardia eucalypti TaxID=648755 RepID=A0ABP9Q2U5_9PSEU|nr:ketosteroid isomerase-like protein [Pseudonocardia eucalypti]
MAEPVVAAGPSVERVFRAVDAMDAEGLGALLAEDARMVFGNAPPLVGRAAILSDCLTFAAAIQRMEHRVLRHWVVGADTIAEARATYTRLDGSGVTIPVVSIWTARADGLISHYRVYYDPSPIFA